MKKKLLLRRDTVRKLGVADLHEVAGGAERTRECNSAECTILPMIPDNTFPAQPLPPRP